MSMQAGSRKPVRFRERSYLAYMLTPEPPVYEWLADLTRPLRPLRRLIHRPPLWEAIVVGTARRGFSVKPATVVRRS